MATVSVINNSGQTRTFYGDDLVHVTLELGMNPNIDADLWKAIVNYYYDDIQELLDTNKITVVESAPAPETPTEKPTPTPTPAPETPTETKQTKTK